MNPAAICRLWQRPRVQKAGVVLAAVVGLAVVGLGVRRVFFGSSEFAGFRQIVQVAVVHGGDQYHDIGHVRAYPPFFALFWAPFGLLPWGPVPDENDVWGTTTPPERVQIGLQALVLLVLMVALTVPSARCIAAACGAPSGARDCLPALLLLLTGPLMLNSAIRCETDMFILALVAGGACLIFGKDRQWEGGFLWGVAAALKLTPGLLGVYLICRRRWRELAGMAVAGALCTVVLPALVWGPAHALALHRSWADQVLSGVTEGGAERFIPRLYRSTNQSLEAGAMRYLTDYNAGKSNAPRYVNVADLPAPTVRRIVTVLRLCILAGLLALWVSAGAKCTRTRELLLLALAPLGMLVLSPVSVGGHYAIIAVPVGVLCAVCLAHPDDPVVRRIAWGGLIGLALVYGIAVPLLKCLSFPLFGAFVLGGVLVYAAFSRVGEGGHAGAPGPRSEAVQ